MTTRPKIWQKNTLPPNKSLSTLEATFPGTLFHIYPNPKIKHHTHNITHTLHTHNAQPQTRTSLLECGLSSHWNSLSSHPNPHTSRPVCLRLCHPNKRNIYTVNVLLGTALNWYIYICLAMHIKRDLFFGFCREIIIYYHIQVEYNYTYDGIDFLCQ